MNYKKIYHPSSKICLLIKRLCVGVSVVYLPRAYIMTCYHGDIVISKIWNIKVKNPTTEYEANWKVGFMRLIKFLICRMDVVSIKQQNTYPYLQCVMLHYINMILLTESVCCVVVQNAQVLLRLTMNCIVTHKECALHSFLIYIQLSHVVHCAEDAHLKKREYVYCVPQWNLKTQMEKFISGNNVC